MPGAAARRPDTRAEGDDNGFFLGCPVDAAFSSFGKKWSLLILRDLLKGDRHFTELLAHVAGLNPKSLSARLKELERDGLVAKRVAATTPVRIEYELTEKGRAILPVLRSMVEWSVRWAPERVFTNGRRPAEIAACVEAWDADMNRRLAPLGGRPASPRRLRPREKAHR